MKQNSKTPHFISSPNISCSDWQPLQCSLIFPLHQPCWSLSNISFIKWVPNQVRSFSILDHFSVAPGPLSTFYTKEFRSSLAANATKDSGKCNEVGFMPCTRPSSRLFSKLAGKIYMVLLKCLNSFQKHQSHHQGFQWQHSFLWMAACAILHQCHPSLFQANHHHSSILLLKLDLRPQ